MTPASPQAFSTASFDASTTTNGGPACLHACSYAWNFGDGTTDTGRTVSHTYDTGAARDVTLTVRTSQGASSTKTKSVRPT